MNSPCNTLGGIIYTSVRRYCIAQANKTNEGSG